MGSRKNYWWLYSPFLSATIFYHTFHSSRSPKEESTACSWCIESRCQWQMITSQTTKFLISQNLKGLSITSVKLRKIFSEASKRCTKCPGKGNLINKTQIIINRNKKINQTRPFVRNLNQSYEKRLKNKIKQKWIQLWPCRENIAIKVGHILLRNNGITARNSESNTIPSKIAYIEGL